MRIKLESKYFKWGATVFMVVALSMILFFSLYRFDELLSWAGVITKILAPFIYGLVMAYLLGPLFNITRNNCLRVNWPKCLKSKKHPTNPNIFMAKLIASITVIVAMLALITGLLWMVLPQLVQSIISIAKVLPEAINDFIAWFGGVVEGRPQVAGPVDKILNSFVASFTDWVEATVVPNYEDVISGISTGVFGALNMVMNFFIGVIICIFFLNSKEIFAAQVKKLVFAGASEERADSFFRGSLFVNKTFGGFINGKLLDSLIIGILCFAVMSVFQWPFAALISVIIGVTNIIPFFGPFIGAIPSTLLILMVDPWTALYFVIFILILQQVDGNIIGPKILGGTTGISSFWVLFAILVGGGLFGFVGMILGIPIFASIYAYACFKVNKVLEKKGLSTDLTDYSYIYKDKMGIEYKEPKIKRIRKPKIKEDVDGKEKKDHEDKHKENKSKDKEI